MHTLLDQWDNLGILLLLISECENDLISRAVSDFFFSALV